MENPTQTKMGTCKNTVGDGCHVCGQSDCDCEVQRRIANEAPEPPSLEAATAVVLTAMKEAEDFIRSTGHKSSYVSLTKGDEPFYASGDGSPTAWGETPMEAAKKLKAPKTKREKLLAELAELDAKEAA